MNSTGAFQQLVARRLLGIPELRPFALAGGLALIAHQIIDRETPGVDIFGAPGADVAAARDAFLTLAEEISWTVETIKESDTFIRMQVSDGSETTLLDLAIDTPAPVQVINTDYGRVMSISELAGRKLMAIFDRAEARDFADVFCLRDHQTQNEMIEFCRSVDLGFSSLVLAEMFGAIGRFRDEDIPLPVSGVAECRRWFAAWALDLGR